MARNNTPKIEHEDTEKPEFEAPKIEVEEQSGEILKEPITEEMTQTEPEITSQEPTFEEPPLPDKSEEYLAFAKTVHSIVISVANMKVEEDKKEMLDQSGARVFQKWDKWQFIEKYGSEATYILLWGDIIQANYFSKKAEKPQEQPPKEIPLNPVQNEAPKQKEGFSDTLARL